ncbi:DUF2637 domain-containing protein [Amycolatopsis sp. NPDC088138]|uniref:DUF2637 domain-containing protein n=1 Tax=Amycolatopsis sp. NPDC088138 TaxID=3363938 RepID=UPI00381BC6B5
MIQHMLRHSSINVTMDLCTNGVCTGLVALGAACASYRHGREFALRSGADAVTASIWPLLVDGLLTIATVELWKTHRDGSRPDRWVAWLAFMFGICLSLVANTARRRR